MFSVLSALEKTLEKEFETSGSTEVFQSQPLVAVLLYFPLLH